MTIHDTEQILDRLIVGRVTPHIYAFTTNTVPNYLKVGDTYRPVSVRLHEWETYFPELTKQFEGEATINRDVYFRDYSVHKFLEEERHKPRLRPEQLQQGIYYSREFFGRAEADDVQAALDDIHKDYEANGFKYHFYDANTRIQQPMRYERGEEWQLRPNQADAVNAFVRAVRREGRTNLLMYAVMRFGKTFTSLCCAKAIGARRVLVVSAKADVKSEWKKTVETAGNFKGWEFVDSSSLLNDANIINEVTDNGGTAVIFLTLQDLQGEELKEKHRSVFNSDIDVLIVDETHFGARSAEYGRVLREAKQPIDPQTKSNLDCDDQVDPDVVAEHVKQLHAKVQLHLSGTPYRILMGSEFKKQDIICFVQFSDIVHEQERWDRLHLKSDDTNEWDNPYYGFPQMVRFAFNPNESSRKKMHELHEQGITFTMSALLEPRSVRRDGQTNEHRKFKHKREILDLLRVIDGTQADENVLSFLNYDKIKKGQMCQHIVMVLPYKASCDAMEQLISDHKDEFKNIRNYQIINISGLDGEKNYKTPEDVKRTISEAAENKQKTLTLTVNRMLTGSTVEQWDTMLFLKDTSSPQEYDQAVFRLQNQYTRTLVSTTGEIIKENLKPQTLLVDFDPERMFRMQEAKSLIYNVNTETNGNDKLEERLREELRISPIVTINAGKINEVQATDILQAVSKYNNKRSIADEARDIPVDDELFRDEEILTVIRQQAEIGSQGGLTIPPNSGDTEDLDPGIALDDAQETIDDPSSNAQVDTAEENHAKDEQLSLARKLQTYYQRILFYAMLTPTSEHSLNEIIETIGRGENSRIARNLGLEPHILQKILDVVDPFVLSALDYKIQNISTLGSDESLTPMERAEHALQKFTRISSSEIRTPAWLCHNMIEEIPADRLKEMIERGDKILDIASKSGEFAVAIYQRLTEELNVDSKTVRDSIYSIPTSTIAYEFTRRFYEILGLNTDNIAGEFTSYDLLNIKTAMKDSPHSHTTSILTQNKSFNTVNLDEEPVKEGVSVKFGAVVGNPPYQESDGGAQRSARPIYHKFIEIAEDLNSCYLSFVIPTRWYLGGKGLDSFRSHMLANNRLKTLHDFLKPDEVFPGTNNRGGICYFLSDSNYCAASSGGTEIVTHYGDGREKQVTRPMDTFGLGVFVRDSVGVDIVNQVLSSEAFMPFSDCVSVRKPFGLEGNFVNSGEFKKYPNKSHTDLKCYGKKQSIGYVSRKLVQVHTDWVPIWKVFMPYANNIGTELNDDNQNAFIGEPNSICTETFLVAGLGMNLDSVTCEELVKYLKTKFARFLHSMAKISQHGTKQTYRFLPVPDLSESSKIDWAKSIDEIDDQLFDHYKLTEEQKEHICASIKKMQY